MGLQSARRTTHPADRGVRTRVPKENGRAKPTFLEHVLQLQGDSRTRLLPLNITPMQAGVLFYLQRCPSTGAMKMARDFNVQPPTMTPVVQGLVRKGYIVREESPHNRRALPLTLSPRGQSFVKQILAKTRGITCGHTCPPLSLSAQLKPLGQCLRRA